MASKKKDGPLWGWCIKGDDEIYEFFTSEEAMKKDIKSRLSDMDFYGNKKPVIQVFNLAYEVELEIEIKEVPLTKQVYNVKMKESK